MENTEIMVNDEVMEAAEDFVPTGSGNALKAIGVGLAIVGAIYGGYKLIKKLKAKKEAAEEVEGKDYNEIDEAEGVYEVE